MQDSNKFKAKPVIRQQLLKKFINITYRSNLQKTSSNCFNLQKTSSDCFNQSRSLLLRRSVNAMYPGLTERLAPTQSLPELMTERVIPNSRLRNGSTYSSSSLKMKIFNPESLKVERIIYGSHTARNREPSDRFFIRSAANHNLARNIDKQGFKGYKFSVLHSNRDRIKHRFAKKSY